MFQAGIFLYHDVPCHEQTINHNFFFWIIRNLFINSLVQKAECCIDLRLVFSIYI